jgi:hypothetical protein
MTQKGQEEAKMDSVIPELSRSLGDVLVNHIHLSHLKFHELLQVNGRRGLNKMREYTVVADQSFAFIWQVLGLPDGRGKGRTCLYIPPIGLKRRSVGFNAQMMPGLPNGTLCSAPPGIR